MLVFCNACLLQNGKNSSCAQRMLSLKISQLSWAPLPSKAISHRILPRMSLNRVPPLITLLIICIKKLSSSCSRNLDCLCPAISTFQQILLWLKRPKSTNAWDVTLFPPALRMLYLPCLVDEKVYSRYQNIPCVGLSFDLRPQALHWFTTSPQTPSTQNTPLCRAQPFKGRASHTGILLAP